MTTLEDLERILAELQEAYKNAKSGRDRRAIVEIIAAIKKQLRELGGAS